MKDLIIKTEGKIISSNFEEFEQSALAVIESINTELVTDEDFAQAVENVKSCKEIEVALANAKQQAMMEQADIAELFRMVDKLSDKFREARLTLERSVKSEKENRKNQIIADGMKEVVTLGDGFLKDHFQSAVYLDEQEKRIKAAIKGKKSLKGMWEAVEDVLDAIKEEMEGVKERYLANISAIESVEAEFPLFPDKEKLALKDVETVRSEIKARQNEYKLKQKEIEERKAREQAAKEAAEREAAKASAKEQAQESEENPLNDTREKGEPEQPTPEETSSPDERTILVKFQGSNLQLRQAVGIIKTLNGVVDVQV